MRMVRRMGILHPGILATADLHAMADAMKMEGEDRKQKMHK